MNRIGFLIILFTISINSISQHSDVELSYISPKPGSRFIMPENNIAIRHGDRFDLNSVRQSILDVSSSNNEKISGEIKLSDDARTLIFKPSFPYLLGDKIQVVLNSGLKIENGQEIQSIQFQFEIIDKRIYVPEEYYVKELIHNLLPFQYIPILSIKRTERKENNLPEGYPGIQVNILTENATKGFYFFAPYDDYGLFPETKQFITITDVYGTPVYYRKLITPGYDLKIQPTGNLSFYSFHPFWKNMVMDSAYQIIDEYKMGNGYTYTDFHDFQLLENGHAFVMTYDPQFYPMDTVVQGGHPNATVIGFVFQELDSNKDVIFQWRSWDHFLITDVGSYVNLTDSVVDYVHGNTMEIESDTTILISCRNMDEITRVHRNTGEIIWRFGGINNQFEFLNDTLGFTVQHDSRRLSNGNISIFDNGSLHPDPKYSSGLEYEMDEVNMTASLVTRLRSTPDIFGVVMGNMQWKGPNSKIIGWGWGVPGISEFDMNGDVVYEMEFEGISYRAYLFPWKSNYFLINKDTLQFGFIWEESTLTKTIEVFNNSNHEIQLTSYYTMNNAFTIENEFPIAIPSNQNVQLNVKFTPDAAGEFDGMMTINSDINSDTLVQRIAQQVYLVGNATAGQSIDQPGKLSTLIYPNPASKNIIVDFGKHLYNGPIRLFSVFGECIFECEVIDKQIFTINISGFQSGIYFIYLEEFRINDPMYYKIIKY